MGQPAPVAPVKKQIIKPTSTPLPSKSTVSIKISGAKSLLTMITGIKQKLITSGFNMIEEDSSGDTVGPRTYVIYSSSINSIFKSEIQIILKNIIPTIQEDPPRESSYDVMVVLGK